MNPFILQRKKYFKVSGIYKITCLKNNKIYIGSAKNLYYRIQMHYDDLSKNKHRNRYLQNSYNKYGLNNFHIEIVEFCSINDLTEKEQKWIDSEDCVISKGFNINPTSVSCRGIKWSQKSKHKLSKSKMGIKHSKEHKEAISNGHKKPVKCVEDNIIFDSINSACEYYKIHKSTLSNYLKGRYKKLKINKTFIWEI